MEKKKTTAEIVLSLGEIVLGNIMYAAAVVLFIVPNGLITGGTTGLALFVNHSIGIPISLFVSVFNVLMFLLGAWVLGKQFALTTVLSTIIYPVILGSAIHPMSMLSSVSRGTAMMESPFRLRFKMPLHMVYPFNPMRRLNRVALSLT